MSITARDAERISQEHDMGVVAIIGWDGSSKTMTVVIHGRDGCDAAAKLLDQSLADAFASSQKQGSTP